MSMGLTKSVIYFFFINSSIVSLQYLLEQICTTFYSKVSFCFKNGLQDTFVIFLSSSSSYSVRKGDLC